VPDLQSYGGRRVSEAVEFGEKPAADAYRDEHPEHICPVDDDRRFKTVHFTSDTPEWLLDQARAQADEGRAAREDTTGQADLTDAERDRIDFSDPRASVPWARSIKALAEKYGVSDWTSYVDGTLSVDEHRQVMEEAGQEGGGARDDGDQRDAERERQAAAREQAEGCDHARDHCEHGDPDACEYIQNACGYEEDEVSSILGEPEESDEITGDAAGALARIWGGYKAAIARFERELGDIEEAKAHAEQAAASINAIRDEHGQDAMQFDRLEELTDGLQAVADGAHDHEGHIELIDT